MDVRKTMTLSDVTSVHLISYALCYSVCTDHSRKCQQLSSDKWSVEDHVSTDGRVFALKVTQPKKYGLCRISVTERSLNLRTQVSNNTSFEDCKALEIMSKYYLHRLLR